MAPKARRTYTDEELVKACLAEDARAWEVLIERYKGLIYSIPFRYGLSEVEAEDIFQSVCTILLQKLEWVRDYSKISSWLVTTTSRECWRISRRKRKEEEATEYTRDEIFASWELSDEAIETLEREQIVRRAISQLSETCQKVIEYLFYSDRKLSHKEIAQQLHLSQTSISTIRARCLNRLRMILERNGFFKN